MSEAPESSSADEDTPVRSTGGVLIIVGALIALPLFLLLAVFVFSGTRNGSDAVEGGIIEGRIQAVYMANDRVFFGNLEPAEGDWLTLRDAFYLRQGDAAGKDAGAATTDLVPMQQEVGGDGDMLVNAREIVLVQNLATDSEIASKIEDAIG